MGWAKATCKLCRQLAISLGLFTKQVELILLVAVMEISIQMDERKKWGQTHNSPVRVLISFLSNASLSATNPTLATRPRSSLSRQMVGSRMPVPYKWNSQHGADENVTPQYCKATRRKTAQLEDTSFRFFIRDSQFNAMR